MDSQRPSMRPVVERIHPPWDQRVWCDAGWDDLVIELDRRLADIDPDYEVHQIKEKFGGLRYHCSLDRHPASTFIAEAEQASARTCERCGAAGTTERTTGYVRTLCPGHTEEHLFDRQVLDELRRRRRHE